MMKITTQNKKLYSYYYGTVGMITTNLKYDFNFDLFKRYLKHEYRYINGRNKQFELIIKTLENENVIVSRYLNRGNNTHCLYFDKMKHFHKFIELFPSEYIIKAEYQTKFKYLIYINSIYNSQFLDIINKYNIDYVRCYDYPNIKFFFNCDQRSIINEIILRFDIVEMHVF